MTERDLARWVKFSTKRGFPARRNEIQLALLGVRIAQMMGAKEVTLQSFMIDEKADKPAKDITATDGALAFNAFTGKGIRKLGQKRKRN